MKKFIVASMIIGSAFAMPLAAVSQASAQACLITGMGAEKCADACAPSAWFGPGPFIMCL